MTKRQDERSDDKECCDSKSYMMTMRDPTRTRHAEGDIVVFETSIVSRDSPGRSKAQRFVGAKQGSGTRSAVVVVAQSM